MTDRVKSVHIQSFSVRMWENTDQKNSEYWHFSRSVNDPFSINEQNIKEHIKPNIIFH